MKNQETFASLFDAFQNHYDPAIIFDDFLTLSIEACGVYPQLTITNDASLYLETMKKYKDDTLRYNFPKMLKCLFDEMTERISNNEGNDILGEFYEARLAT